MGHANLENISRFFIRRLYAKGTVSMRECVDAMVKKGVTFNASEGPYTDDYMLALGLGDVIWFLLGGSTYMCPLIVKHIIEPDNPTDRERYVLKAWARCDISSEDEYRVLDNIRWRFAPGWRKKYKEIPILGNIEH